MNLKDKKVAIHFVNSIKYPAKAPFDPPVKYPEYRGEIVDPENQVYAGIRNILFRLGLDHENFNKKNWNPFGQHIKPGMTVFIKPNIVRHEHLGGKDVFSVIVHASILRPILDYVCIALKDKGKIIIGDSQVYLAHFEHAIVASHIKDLLEFFNKCRSIPIDCIDLRINRGVRSYLWGMWGRKPVKQDSRGYEFVDLGTLSKFNKINPKRLRIGHENPKIMYKHHSHGKHQYLFPKSFLQSDVIINISKMKTHRRTAVTLALKNIMGLPALKGCLPHYITGSVKEGGDEYIHPSLRKRICTLLNDKIHSNPFIPLKFIFAVMKNIIWASHKILPFGDNIYEAMWYGNDTLWRTLVDLNRAVLYADKDGRLCKTPQRHFFGLVDGIIAGEKNGPVSPEPFGAGVIVAGHNPVAIDAVSSTLMGFDINKIPMIKNAMMIDESDLPLFLETLNDIKIIDGDKEIYFNDLVRKRFFQFEPHPNWKGHVEL
jgi:uncharacterized protein (DUF362 family)